ncbi:PREDICTED: thiamine-triphosphatase-like isoform X1 [Branchiostoma belcheri]|uniref:Thiamine-triphosphatase n=1 Tax=Branchiostoma belcheri TaxID=7741 RepID=A0A6P5A105_BRABE|nr:PREDICTED: thiamine-triphosphatase-like isoform X1 [Branchiostoma belcheri]
MNVFRLQTHRRIVLSAVDMEVQEGGGSSSAGTKGEGGDVAGGGEGASGPRDHNNKPSGVIEVERKFSFSEGSEEKLRKAGAVCKEESSFHDVYFDTEEFVLTLADHWLRKREGRWELKCPPASRDRASLVEQYVELQHEADILKQLAAILNVRAGSVDELVRRASCEPFCNFQTDRKTYTLEGGFKIDLDQTDFGFRVGEIELICQKQDDVPEALRKIDALAEKLGFVSKTKIPGKMSAFLKTFREKHYDALVKGGLLTPIT